MLDVPAFEEGHFPDLMVGLAGPSVVAVVEAFSIVASPWPVPWHVSTWPALALEAQARTQSHFSLRQRSPLHRSTLAVKS